MSTFIPPTPAANKSAEQHEEPSEQDSFNHLLYKVLRLTSEQVQDLNDWMAHREITNVHEVIAQNFRKSHALDDNLKFITQGKTSYIQSNVMISLSLMISYIKHRQYSAKSKYFGPFYNIQIDPQEYDEWHTSPPEEEIHFSGPNDEDEHQNLSSDHNQVIQQENVCSEPPEPLSYSLDSYVFIACSSWLRSWRLAAKTEEISVYDPQSSGGASKRMLRLVMMRSLKSP